MLTTALADRLGVTTGDTVTVGERATPLAVVGTVDSTSRDDDLAALVTPSALAGAATSARPPQDVHLVDLPTAATWADVQRANAAGYLLSVRADVPDAPPVQTYDSGQSTVLTALALVVGMTLLEIVLLAGPAFAVGAKRQQRQLALLQATGAQRSDVGRVVLASGLVLGAVGGVTGVVLGLGLATGAVPALVAWQHTLPGPFEVRPLELAAIALVGVGIAVAAALLPARNAARQDPLAGLTGRRGVTRGRSWLPVVGLAATVAGAVVAYQAALARSVNGVLAGSILAELGLVAVTPFLVGQVGRLGPLLPVAPRLALRDAARNRGRTAPAVSAILAAVAGSVAVGTYVASQDRYDEERYTPSARMGSAVVQLDPSSGSAEAARTALTRALPDAEVLLTRSVASFTTASPSLSPVLPEARRCPLEGLTSEPTAAQLRLAESDPRCSGDGGGSSYTSYFPGELVGGPDLLHAVTGVSDPAADRVLAAGGVVVPSQYLRGDGTVEIVVQPAEEPAEEPTGAPAAVTDPPAGGRSVVLPAAALPGSAGTTFYSDGAARTLGITPGVVGLTVVPGHPLSTAEEDTARGALQRSTPTPTSTSSAGTSATTGSGCSPSSWGLR